MLHNKGMKVKVKTICTSTNKCICQGVQKHVSTTWNPGADGLVVEYWTCNWHSHSVHCKQPWASC